MPSWLRLVFNVLKTFWWVVILIIVTVCGIFYLVKKRNKSQDNNLETESFVSNVSNRVLDSVTDAKIEHAIINAETSIKKKELEEIRNEINGEKRRRKLASILKKSL